MDAQVKEQQLIRLKEASITFSTAKAEAYINAPDEIIVADNEDIPEGYKRCGRCRKVMKLYLFNRNKQSKSNCSGNCKHCQKQAASKSYDKNKGSRDYKAYYAKNKEAKKAQGQKYYQNNKATILNKQKEYRDSPKGKKVMDKAHRKRRRLMKKNAGIPYTREMVIDRDKLGKEYPICILCGKPIENLSRLHLEHLIPVVEHGKDCFTNVACSHDTCNLTKSKDAAEITVEQVQTVADRAEAYIEAHPEMFPALFEANK